MLIDRELIDKAIVIDKRMKEDKKELDKLKAQMQAAALAEMDNKNLKYIESFGNDGSVIVTNKEGCEIDNFSILSSIVGKALIDKIKREESVNYKFDNKVKKVLTALYKKDYAKHDIKTLLVNMGLDEDKIKTASKKLKGEYVKDKALLESLGLDAKALEEELDAIREQKNYELITKFVDDPEQIDIDILKRAISVEESLSIGLNYMEG